MGRLSQSFKYQRPMTLRSKFRILLIGKNNPYHFVENLNDNFRITKKRNLPYVNFCT